MENNELYYEVTSVTKPSEIKAAYEYAIEHNYKYYRCVSPTGKYYYWNGETYKQIPSQFEWAENTSYQEPIVEAEEEEIAEEAETISDEVNETAETPEIATTTATVEQTKDNTQEVLKEYTDKIAELEEENKILKTKIEIITEAKESVEDDLADITEALYTLDKYKNYEK